MDVLLSTSGIVIIVVMVLLTFVLWKVAKLILIPVQILLFLALMLIAYKLLFTPERLGMLSEGSSNESIRKLIDSEVARKIADKVKDGTLQAGKAALDSVRSGGAQRGTAPAAPGKAEAKPAAEGKE